MVVTLHTNVHGYLNIIFSWYKDIDLEFLGEKL